MTVVQFPTRPQVLVYAGSVSQTQVHSADGVTVLQHVPPLKLYFVEVRDAAGEFGVWDGPDYLDAISVAREWAAGGAAIRDLTNNRRGPT